MSPTATCVPLIRIDHGSGKPVTRTVEVLRSMLDREPAFLDTAEFHRTSRLHFIEGTEAIGAHELANTVKHRGDRVGSFAVDR
ncbi:MAG TPA: hypothetical protein DDZ51_19685 [Planctomycetaceae bacterium]|nr:hypothetical protein [Planctomycetaceae bacterium]